MFTMHVSWLHVWRSEDNLWGSKLSFCLVGPGKIGRFGGRCFYPLSLPDGPWPFFTGMKKSHRYLCLPYTLEKPLSLYYTFRQAPYVPAPPADNISFNFLFPSRY